jgi:hypothetical protein
MHGSNQNGKTVIRLGKTMNFVVGRIIGFVLKKPETAV